MNNNNWKNICKDFSGHRGKEYQKYWEEQGFDYQSTKKWKEVLKRDFKFSDFSFCTWLRDEKHLAAEVSLQTGDLEKLRKEYQKLWIDINGDFSHYASLGKTYQQLWEERGITYQTVQEWINLGFQPDDFYWVEDWKDRNFDSQTTKPWIEAGFNPKDVREVKQWQDEGFTPQQAAEWIKLTPRDYEFAAYLRVKDVQSRQENLDLKQLKKDFNAWWEKKTASEYLNCCYPREQRKTIKYLDICDKNLTGALDLSDFVNLEELYCYNNQLTDLNLGKCLKLKRLNCENNKLTKIKTNHLTNLARFNCWNNQLTSLDLTNCNQLELLGCWNNHLQEIKFPSWVEQLTDLNMNNNKFPAQDLSCFTPFINLQKLYIDSNFFHGSLKPLQSLRKLEILNINNTNIESGLEHLPESIKDFRCSSKEKSKNKVKAIEEELRNFGEPLNENFAVLLRKWKEDKSKEESKEALRQAEERRIITLLVPVEKLATAQRDIKKFLNNWNKEKLDKLKDKPQLRKYKTMIGTVQWTSRVVSVGGGIALIQGQLNIGGWVAVVCPFIEVLTSQLEKSIYENNKERWKEFEKATDKLLDTYWELNEILGKIAEEPIKGKIQVVLKDLKEKIHNFLEKYDKNKDGKIDEEEWEIAKKKFTQDLKENWLERRKQLKEIQETTEKLEEEVSGYRQEAGSKVEEERHMQQLNDQLMSQEEIFFQDNSQQNLLAKPDHEIIELDQIQTEQQAQILQPPHGIPSSSKK